MLFQLTSNFFSNFFTFQVTSFWITEQYSIKLKFRIQLIFVCKTRSHIPYHPGSIKSLPYVVVSRQLIIDYFCPSWAFYNRNYTVYIYGWLLLLNICKNVIHSLSWYFYHYELTLIIFTIGSNATFSSIKTATLSLLWSSS